MSGRLCNQIQAMQLNKQFGSKLVAVDFAKMMIMMMTMLIMTMMMMMMMMINHNHDLDHEYV